MRFRKYHALGNDYLVLREKELTKPLTEQSIIRWCDRHMGVGSDGILLYREKNGADEHVLQIFNPDGSEAEKSGNGLRIFSRYLWDLKLVNGDPFPVATKGGLVRSQIFENGREVEVEMGSVSFKSDLIPVAGPSREVLEEPLSLATGRSFTISAATVGNPHCVILVDETQPELAKEFGREIETHPSFPNRTNVQFAQVLDRKNIRLEIWERGAGYTLASGSSSSAAAAVCYRLGKVDSDVRVHMPGGQLSITITPGFDITMKGPVTFVAEGTASTEFLEWRY